MTCDSRKSDARGFKDAALVVVVNKFRLEQLSVTTMATTNDIDEKPARTSDSIDQVEQSHGHGKKEDIDLQHLGYKPELIRTRSLYTILFQSLAIAAVPFGEGTALLNAVIGGGQLAYFVGWIVVCILDQCIAMSLSELASRFPTASGPYYWTFNLSKGGRREALSFFTGWAFLIGNWTITLSVNFGTASLIAGTVTMYHPDWYASAWQLLLIFYAFCIGIFLICAFGNRLLPYIDTAASVWNAVTILVVLIGLSATASVGRHSAADTLGHYDKSLSGWGGFTFFIGLLPAAYTFAALGLISSMAEECRDPAVDLPKALSLCIPIAGIAGLFFIIPICATLPPLRAILKAPAAQGLPYIFHTVMGTPGGGLALMFFVLIVAVFCSISITVAASRCTWAFSRDGAVPGWRIWSKVSSDQTPVNALALMTVIQMLLGLINLGSTTAFTAFASVGTIALAAAYATPVLVSILEGRRSVSSARFRWPSAVGWTVNVLTVAWVAFQLVLFSMPAALPVTLLTMNWCSVVFVGFMFLSAVYYLLFARKGTNPGRSMLCCSVTDSLQFTRDLQSPMVCDYINRFRWAFDCFVRSVICSLDFDIVSIPLPSRCSKSFERDLNLPISVPSCTERLDISQQPINTITSHTPA